MKPLVLIALIIAVNRAPRQLALGVAVLCFWVLCFVFDMALSYEGMVDHIGRGFVIPQPQQQLPSMLFIMLLYTAAIPGVPFTTASLACWGVGAVAAFNFS